MTKNSASLDPIHPGEILLEEFMRPYQLSANRLAGSIGVPANRITAIINGQRAISAETAILLAHAFKTTPQFWINLQSHYDLQMAERSIPAPRVAAADNLARTLEIA